MAIQGQGLGLTQTQQQKQMMTMSPIQRQSLDILQLPILALEQKIREEAETNPAIDEVIVPKMELDAPVHDSDCVESEKKIRENDDDIQIHELPPSRSYNSDDADDRRRYIFESLKQPISLEDHLRSQINTAGFDASQSSIAEMIIANLSSTGMLSVTTEEIAEVSSISLDKVESVLTIIQNTFDPPGIAARTAQERLVLQLKATYSPLASLAIRIVNECLDDLISGLHNARIASLLNVSKSEVADAIELIHGLNPNPVAEYDIPAPTDYIIPEINVIKDKAGAWTAVYETDTTPRITINQDMATYLEDEHLSSQDKSYIRERIRSAEALSHSLEQRAETILKVATAIVDIQQDFFTYGVSKLKPMTLSDVADKINRHETTVGRATEGKYLRSPQGVYELKYFFSTGLKSAGDDGAIVSNKAVIERIMAIIKSENLDKPYSDQDIAEILKKEGIEISRRTIAKYRDAKNIPSSGKRKRRR